MKKILTISTKISVSLFLLWLLIKFTKLDFVKVWTLLQGLDLKWFWITVLMYLLTTFTNTYRWQILANLLDFKLAYPHALRLYFESAFSNNFLPTNFGGDALRAFDLGKNSQKWLKAASTVFMERLFGFAMMFALIPVGLIYSKFTNFQHLLPNKLELSLWLSFIITILGMASYKIWTQIPLEFIQKIRFTIDEYTRCKKSLVKVALWTFITHVIFVMGNIFAAKSLGLSLNEIPLWYWLILSPASTVAGFFVPALKGIGAKEACYVYMLSLLKINSETALAIAFLTFLATLISTLPGLSIGTRVGQNRLQ